MNRATSARRRMLLVALILALVAVACVPRRMGVSWADISVVDDNVMVAYNDQIVLIDPANGVPSQLRDSEGQIRTDENNSPRRWVIDGSDTGSQFFTTPVQLDNDVVLIADYNFRLFTANLQNACLSNRSGSCIDNPTGISIDGHIIAETPTGDGLVFLPFSEKNVVAYDLETLEQVWVYETERGIWGTPIYADEVLYVPRMDHYFTALDASTGEEIWSVDVGGAIAAQPLHQDDRFYLGTITREVFEVSTDGEILAEYKTRDWVWGSPVIYDDVLYITDLGGSVYALDTTANLAELWRTDTDSDGFRSGPVATENYVIAAARDGKVFWLQRSDGSELIEQDIDAEILSDIVLMEREDETLVLVSSTKGSKTLVAFTLDGAPRWTYER